MHLQRALTPEQRKAEEEGVVGKDLEQKDLEKEVEGTKEQDALLTGKDDVCYILPHLFAHGVERRSTPHFLTRGVSRRSTPHFVTRGVARRYKCRPRSNQGCRL